MFAASCSQRRRVNLHTAGRAESQMLTLERFHARVTLIIAMAAPLKWTLIRQTKSDDIQAIATEMIKV